MKKIILFVPGTFTSFSSQKETIKRTDELIEKLISEEIVGVSAIHFLDSRADHKATADIIAKHLPSVERKSSRRLNFDGGENPKNIAKRIVEYVEVIIEKETSLDTLVLIADHRYANQLVDTYLDPYLKKPFLALVKGFPVRGCHGIVIDIKKNEAYTIKPPR